MNVKLKCSLEIEKTLFFKLKKERGKRSPVLYFPSFKLVYYSSRLPWKLSGQKMKRELSIQRKHIRKKSKTCMHTISSFQMKGLFRGKEGMAVTDLLVSWSCPREWRSSWNIESSFSFASLRAIPQSCRWFWPNFTKWEAALYVPSVAFQNRFWSQERTLVFFEERVTSFHATYCELKLRGELVRACGPALRAAALPGNKDLCF